MLYSQGVTERYLVQHQNMASAVAITQNIRRIGCLVDVAWSQYNISSLHTEVVIDAEVQWSENVII